MCRQRRAGNMYASPLAVRDECAAQSPVFHQDTDLQRRVIQVNYDGFAVQSNRAVGKVVVLTPSA
jgi:hypothetical protein